MASAAALLINTRQRKGLLTEILAVFRSRTQALDCRTKLNAHGIPAKVVATPSQLKIGCGYSVKFHEKFARAVKNIINAAGYGAFYGYVTDPRTDGK